MTIERIAVESSNIASIGYDADTTTAYVEFRSGAVYAYEGVPADIYDEFRNSESLGRYLASVIKPTYPATFVTDQDTEDDENDMVDCPEHDEVEGPHHSTECCRYDDERQE